MSEFDATFEHNALAELAREVLEESDESANAYLVQGWLSSAIEALYDARREANLTQKELAELLYTRQSDISRLERDDEGRVTLHRYVKYALACGVLPLNISLRPAAALRNYALHDPEAPRTESAYEAWRIEVPAAGNVAPSTRSIMSDGASLSANLKSLIEGTWEESGGKPEQEVLTVHKEKPKKAPEKNPHPGTQMERPAQLAFAA